MPRQPVVPQANKLRKERRAAEAIGVQRAVPKRHLLDDAEMLSIVAHLGSGGTITEAVGHIPGATVATYFATLRRKPKWRGIVEKLRPDVAEALMDDWRTQTRAAVEANPHNAAILSVAGKAAHVTARAFDPHRWGDRPAAEAPKVLLLKTNLSFDIVHQYEARQRELGLRPDQRLPDHEVPRSGADLSFSNVMGDLGGSARVIEHNPPREVDGTEPAPIEPWRK